MSYEPKGESIETKGDKRWWKSKEYPILCNWLMVTPPMILQGGIDLDTMEQVIEFSDHEYLISQIDWTCKDEKEEFPLEQRKDEMNKWMKEIADADVNAFMMLYKKGDIIYAHWLMRCAFCLEPYIITEYVFWIKDTFKIKNKGNLDESYAHLQLLLDVIDDLLSYEDDVDGLEVIMGLDGPDEREIEYVLKFIANMDKDTLFNYDGKYLQSFIAESDQFVDYRLYRLLWISEDSYVRELVAKNPNAFRSCPRCHYDIYNSGTCGHCGFDIDGLKSDILELEPEDFKKNGSQSLIMIGIFGK